MAIRKIVELGKDDVLRKHSRKVDKFDRRLNILLDDMADTMYAADGAGLAAPQVGILKRCVVIDTGEGLLELIRLLDNRAFTVCYDVGHANICGQDPADMIRALGTQIGCTHIHDNDGTRDSHTLPYYGNIDWERVMKAFAEAGYEGNLNYEAGLFVNNVPVSLREESAKYMASVGKHLVERYWH